ncbi:4-(cytidine 5'-diphospho)-2-C-methyl-D-erythritol kinase [bacterium]|nr:4-(cytidine 5'-diphospho)-2-C-methyl-D-erythritol kinase [bacterium]
MSDHVVLLIVVAENQHSIAEFGSTRLDSRNHVRGIGRVILVGDARLPEHDHSWYATSIVNSRVDRDGIGHSGTEDPGRRLPEDIPTVGWYARPFQETHDMRERLRARGAAKLNLALSVGGPDSDGMHPIASWMTSVDLYDELELVRLPVGYPSRYAINWHEDAQRRSDIDWSVSKDLSVLAHDALERRVDRALAVQARIEKRIPVGGGLGGGSADAAVMLHALNQLFELGLSTDELAEVGGPLGSDVAFQVHGGAAVVAGLGERVELHEPPADLHAVLVLPETACPTGPVYRRFDELQPEARVDEPRVRALLSSPLVADAPFNDLAAAAFDLHPALLEDLERVRAIVEGPVHLSGSGSTLFTICDASLHADLLAAAITEQTGIPAIPVRNSPGIVLDEVER